MTTIGITGGVGCGKSTVLKILEQEYQAYILEADKVAHTLMEPGGLTYQPIIDAFGKEILKENKEIDRKRLGSIVFANQEQLEQLNAITHPAVRADIERQIAEYQKENPDGIFVIEAALLIETGYRDICDEIWYVYANENVRIDRLMKSRGYSKEQCISMMKSQSCEAYYRENCDAVIDNSFDFTHTKTQVYNLLKKF